MTVVSIVLGLIFLIIVVRNIRIVQQTDAFVIERLGSYCDTWGNGLHFKIPFIDKIYKKVSMKEQIYDFPPHPVITKDNVTIQVDTIVFFQVTDAKLYAYGVSNPIKAIEGLTTTTVRNIVGDMELDSTLTSRDVINAKMREILDNATDAWGIKVTRVELRSIDPPKEIKEAMEKQMRAERERRESILRAEGEKNSSILVAEGAKASAILNAEAEKESKVRRAEGEAEALRIVQQALADSIKLLNESSPTDKIIQLKALEAFKDAANGQATKIIVPSNIADFAGMITSLTEVAKTE